MADFGFWLLGNGEYLSLSQASVRAEEFEAFHARKSQEPALVCSSLNRDRMIPGSTAPERVPSLEVGQMAAELDTLAVQCEEDHLA